MPVYLDKSTQRLYIKFRYRGHTYKKRLPEGMKRAEANDIETNWKHRLFNELNGFAQAQTIIYEDFLRLYFFPYAEANYSPDSLGRVILICRESLKFFRGEQMRNIKPADVEKYKTYRANLKTIHGRTRKPATLLRDLAVISKVFSLALRNDFIDYNPYTRVDKPKFDNTQNKILRREDEARYFAAFALDANGYSWAREVCRLVLNTGLRQNDVLGLKKFNVDLEQNTIRLTQGKTKRTVEIPLNAEARSIIDAHWSNKSELLFPSPRTGKQGTSVKRACLAASRRAEIGYTITIKDLRRTFGTRLGELNFAPNVTARLLGHKDNRSVVRYGRETEILRDAVDALNEKPKLRLVKKK